jgi:hypothetical protein
MEGACRARRESAVQSRLTYVAPLAYICRVHLQFLGVDFSRSFRTFREREVAQTFLSVRGECTDRMSVPPMTGTWRERSGGATPENLATPHLSHFLKIPRDPLFK